MDSVRGLVAVQHGHGDRVCDSDVQDVACLQLEHLRSGAFHIRRHVQWQTEAGVVWRVYRRTHAIWVSHGLVAETLCVPVPVWVVVLVAL